MTPNDMRESQEHYGEWQSQTQGLHVYSYVPTKVSSHYSWLLRSTESPQALDFCLLGHCSWVRLLGASGHSIFINQSIHNLVVCAI